MRYIVKDSNDSFQVIEAVGFIPEDVICEAPMDADLSDGEFISFVKDSPIIDFEAKKSKKISEEKNIKLLKIRDKRNSLLSISDWTQLLDCPLSKKEQDSWKRYRQELRDLPNKEDFNPNNVSWPVKE